MKKTIYMLCCIAIFVGCNNENELIKSHSETDLISKLQSFNENFAKEKFTRGSTVPEETVEENEAPCSTAWLVAGADVSGVGIGATWGSKWGAFLGPKGAIIGGILGGLIQGTTQSFVTHKAVSFEIEDVSFEAEDVDVEAGVVDSGADTYLDDIDKRLSTDPLWALSEFKKT